MIISKIYYNICLKFIDSTLPGIFLDYDDINHKVYSIFDILNNKVVLSRAVSFYEDVQGNPPAPLSIPEFINFLDINKLRGIDNYDDSNNIIENDKNPSGKEVILENNLNNLINQKIPN